MFTGMVALVYVALDKHVCQMPKCNINVKQIPYCKSLKQLIKFKILAYIKLYIYISKFQLEMCWLEK